MTMIEISFSISLLNLILLIIILFLYIKQAKEIVNRGVAFALRSVAEKALHTNFYVCNCRHNWQKVGNYDEYDTCPECGFGEHAPYRSIMHIETANF